MTNNYNDEFRIVTEIPELNMKIQNLDTDYMINKTAEAIPDTAIINIWNADVTVLKNLLLKNLKVNVYTQYYDEDFQMLFNGYLADIKFQNIISVPNSASANKVLCDSLLKMKLVNSGNKLREYYINKTYREPVSSTQIINDCMEVMEIKNINYIQNLPEKLYPEFKAVGKPHQVISDICKALNCNYLIQNEILYLGVPSAGSGQQNIIELNRDNSLAPTDKNSNEKIIITGLKSLINPYDFVKCNFDGFEGIYCVSEVYADGNNYNSDGITKLTIKLT